MSTLEETGRDAADASGMPRLGGKNGRSALYSLGQLPVPVVRALVRLQQDLQYAKDLGLDRWQFAVPINELRSLGLTDNDFRWLLLKGLVAHGWVDSQDTGEPKLIEIVHSRRLCERSWFVLTDLGQHLAAGPDVRSRGESMLVKTLVRDENFRSWSVPVPLLPIWDAARQELRLGSCVIKRFKVPAGNQVRILTAFQEENWPARIDDPLSRLTEIDAKRRLHNTINALNRHQRQPALRFLGDGRGLGVCWEVNPKFDLRRARVVM